jgi:hypothetical protein
MPGPLGPAGERRADPRMLTRRGSAAACSRACHRPSGTPLMYLTPTSRVPERYRRGLLGAELRRRATTLTVCRVWGMTRMRRGRGRWRR